jgi:hypothetical protein
MNKTKNTKKGTGKKEKAKKKKYEENREEEEVELVLDKEIPLEAVKTKKVIRKKNKKDQEVISTPKEVFQNEEELFEKISAQVNSNINFSKTINTILSEPSQEKDSKEFDLLLENDKPKEEDGRPRISVLYYTNGNATILSDLKNGRRIFNNKTELSGYEYRENFIEFRQLLFPNLLLNENFSENLSEQWSLESAIFSTFSYDPEFIEPLIEKYKIKTIIIKHSESSRPFESLTQYLTFTHPKIDFMLKWGKFHSKLIILKFKDFLRVIIPTANLTNGDWYYWGQLIWFQDFPLIKKDEKFPNKIMNKMNDFGEYLDMVLTSTMPKNYKNEAWFTNLNLNLLNYDFSNTVVDLIASSSGRFSGQEKTLFGVGRLQQLSKGYSNQRPSLKTSNNRLIVQCSSVGRALKEKFVNDLCEGFLSRNARNMLQPSKLDIIFPTVEYVDSFEDGRRLSGCLFLQKDTFLVHRYKFKIMDLIDDYQHRKTIFHSKFFLSTPENTEIHFDDRLSNNTIFYVGSHNISPSAWGNLEKNNSQVSMANFELGVIFNPVKLRYEEKQKLIKSLIINLNTKYYSNSDIAYIAEEEVD